MIDKSEFIARLDRAKHVLDALPVSSGMVSFLSEELKRGDPPWWKKTQAAWEKRNFVAWNEAWGLFLAAVHFEALNDADNPLVPYFPSCGGTAEADPAGALSQFLAKAPGSFYENLRAGHRRAYIPARAPLWTAPAASFFQSRGLPFYLVELNAGAGLNIAADVVTPVKIKGRAFFDSTLVSARIGLDSKPLLVEDIIQRRWLTAATMPDNVGGIAALDQAVEKIMQCCREDPNFIQLAECVPESAPRFIAENIPADDPDVGLMVLSAATTARMTDAEYDLFMKGLTQTMLPWGDRALWLEIETVRGELYSLTVQLRAHRLMEGSLRTCMLASLDMDKGMADIPEASQAFFAFAK